MTYVEAIEKISGIMKNVTGPKGVSSKVSVAKPEALKTKATSSVLSGRMSTKNPLNRTVSTTASTSALSPGVKPPKVKLKLNLF
jgi:hypothetical protein